MSSAGGNIWVHYVLYATYDKATKEIVSVLIKLEFIHSSFCIHIVCGFAYRTNI